MTGQILRLLRDKPRLSAEYLAGESSAVDIDPHVIDYHRTLDTEPLLKVVEHAMASFAGRPVDSDAWLAPRVHAALRLSRAEAGDKRLWWYLALALVPDYVRWRFPPRGEDKGTPPNRFFGGESKQAISRLWWAAEFFRIGADYTPVTAALAMQDVPNSMLMDYFHNRPMAIAAIRVLEGLNDGKPATSDEVTDVLQAANLMVTTTVLDAVAPDTGPHAAAVAKWVDDMSPDWTLMIDDMPTGPEEDGPEPVLIDAAEAFVRRVAGSIGLPKKPLERAEAAS